MNKDLQERKTVLKAVWFLTTYNCLHVAVLSEIILALTNTHIAVENQWKNSIVEEHKLKFSKESLRI